MGGSSGTVATVLAIKYQTAATTRYIYAENGGEPSLGFKSNDQVRIDASTTTTSTWVNTNIAITAMHNNGTNRYLNINGTTYAPTGVMTSQNINKTKVANTSNTPPTMSMYEVIYYLTNPAQADLNTVRQWLFDKWGM
jgi:hypothetical protein